MADSFSDVMGYQTPLGANSMFADSPFGQDWDIPKAEIYTESPEDNNTLYFTFLPYKDLEKLYSDFVSLTYLTSTNSSHILIAYSIDSDEELLIKIRKDPRIYSSLTSTSVYNYTNPSETVTFSQHLLSRIIQTAPTDFKFERNDVEVALKNAIDDYKFSVDHKDVSQSSNYTTSATSLNQMADKNGKGVKSLLLQINKAIAKMSAEDKFVYNQWVQSKANPYNYFFPVRYKKDNLSADDLRRFLNQLNNIRAAIDELQNGEANSLDKLMQLIALRLTAGGSEIKWLINTPFFNLSKAQRKKYLDMFAESDAAIYSQASISSGVGGGDVVLQLLATAKSQDLIDIILELENEGKLFLLLNNLKLNAFKDVALLISNAYMNYLLSKKDDYLYVAAIEKGHQLKFDNRTFGNANIENFDDKKKKITFETDENILLKLLRGAREDVEGIEGELPKIPIVECNPLDLILFTSVRDVKLEGIELAAGIPYKLPACLVYAIYHQESIDSAILGGLLVLQVALCAVGVGELIAAIEAASAFGIIWTGTGLATDAAFTSTLVPEVQQDYPEYTKAINYIIWARILMEVSSLKSLESEINNGLAKVKASTNKMLSKISSITRRGLENIDITVNTVQNYFLLKWKGKPIFKGSETDIEYFWSKILKDKVGSGTGELMKYLQVISTNMIKQEQNMSCAAACIRQLAKDNNIIIEEELVRLYARTSEDFGTYPDGIIEAMSKVFQGKKIDVGMKYNPNLSDIAMAEKLSEDGSWIALVLPRNSSTQHAIIVDKIVGNKVYIRDPWSLNSDFGKVAVMDINEFEYCWKYAQNWCFRVIN